MRFFTLFAAVPAVLAAVPFLNNEDREGIIPQKYLVKLRSEANEDHLSATLNSLTSILGGAPHFTYNFGAFKGFSITAADNLLELITALPHIEYFEPDRLMSTNALISQSNPTWGLARISSKQRGANRYIYDDSAGAGTYAYVIDTGIYTAHEDFGGRAVWGANLVGDNNNTDGNGHGTHVAGTIGSTTYGVAKKTNLIAVRVLDADGAGSLSQVIAGIEWAVKDATSKGRIGKAVANLSLGGPFSFSTNAAVAEAAESGLFMAVAAGNSGLPTFTASPASERQACTVAASDKNDRRASFSNFGFLVDVFAPGVNITSTWNRGPRDTNTISGTSMASPHVAGLGAYFLALEGPRTADALCQRIADLAQRGAVSNALGSNYLAYNGNGA